MDVISQDLRRLVRLETRSPKLICVKTGVVVDGAPGNAVTETNVPENGIVVDDAPGNAVTQADAREDGIVEIGAPGNGHGN